MDTTVRPLTLLAALAARTRTTPILDLVRTASLAPNDIDVVGKLVSFLATPERTRCLDQWSSESILALDLGRLGQAAWADPDLLAAVRPIGQSHLATRQLWGKVEDNYLAAMAATRRATHALRPLDAQFVERLRLLLVVRALEATLAGIPREKHLRALCARVRQAADKEFDQSWDWIALVSHPESDGLQDFVDATLRRCEDARDPTRRQPLKVPAREFLRELSAVLSGQRVAIDDKYQKTVPCPSSTPGAGWTLSTSGRETLEEAVSGTIVRLADGGDEDQVFLVAEVDTKRPSPAQRIEGDGLVIQSIETVQFLRHSWHRLSPHEEPAFFDRLTELQESPELCDRLGSALVGIATLTSMPLSRMSSIRVQSALADDWTVDLQSGRLRRRPPRSSRRWKADPEAKDWTRPLSKDWEIYLPPSTRTTLQSVRKRGGVSLADIWYEVSPDRTLESWFGERFAAGTSLTRLTSPVVPNILSQQVFESNRDHAQARLLTSSTRTALPSACMYGSFTAEEIRGSLANAVRPELGQLSETDSYAEANGAGSELDVDLARLRKAIKRLTQRVDAAAAEGDRWVEHHNLLTALCVATLFGSTGARPVTSPFESLHWFDFERRLVYVEDKRSGPTQGARLCVLSNCAHQLLVERYLPHLEVLQQALLTRVPSFSEQLRNLARREPACKIPLFFFLRTKPDFDWIEVSETQLDIVCNNPWPLPWNLFRHLHSTQLRRRGLPAEVRDALLSHGERGAESHGEFSWRIPRDDLQLATPAVNALSRDLGFTLPRSSSPPRIQEARLLDHDFSQTQPFGRQARQLRREKAHADAQRRAEADIDRLLKKRPPASLSSADWEEIARRMILREDGVAHALASTRYEVFEDYLAKLWREERVQAKVRRRYIPLGEGRAWFTEDAMLAHRSIEHLRAALDELADLDPRPKPALAGCLAALELALHCRVSNLRVLEEVVRHGPSIEVVRFLGRFWLECAYANEWADGRPVYRVPITDRAAGWISLRRSTKNRLKALPPTPVALTNFGGLGASCVRDLLRRVSDLVSQINAFELPGAIAAVLSGMRESPAMPHSDWIRMTYLEALDRTADGPSDVDVPEPSDATAEFFPHHNQSHQLEHADELSRCTALFDGIQVVLSQPSGISTRRLAVEVSRLVKQSGFEKGSAPFVLSHYVYHLLTRPKKTDASKTLKAATALRYWYALKPGMLDFAFDTYLPALDDQELTELYQRIVDAAESPPGPQDVAKSGAGGIAKRRQVKVDSDAGRRAIKELWLFHEFAREIYGLEDPDWSEISPGIAAGSGRPGIVLMAEYEAILSTLAGVKNCVGLDSQTLSSAFVLIACARFGLRIGEAVGMHYGDWVAVGGATVVLVRSNSVRGLKTDASKRQVPLVGLLGPLEQAVVNEARRRWVLRSGRSARDSALLPDVGSDTFKAQKGRVAKRLMPLIKAATGNRASTVHHLRHGFACRLLAMLAGRSCGLGLPCDDINTFAARRLLLQGDAPDRRTMWAIGRALGHASPATTIKSYIHVVDQWLPLPLSRPALDAVGLAAPFIDLDGIHRIDRISDLEPIPATDVAPVEPLFSRYVQYLSLLAAGHRDACDVALVPMPDKLRLDSALAAVARKVQAETGQHPVSDLITRVPRKRWGSLIKLASGVSGSPPQIDLPTWPPTVGANRQVLLFLPAHFDWMGGFIQALGLTAADCLLVHAGAYDSTLLQYARDARLGGFLMPAQEHGRWFQFDRAVEGTPERIYPNRMAMITKPSGKLATSFELLLMWSAWLAAGHTSVTA